MSDAMRGVHNDCCSFMAHAEPYPFYVLRWWRDQVELLHPDSYWPTCSCLHIAVNTIAPFCVVGRNPGVRVCLRYEDVRATDVQGTVQLEGFTKMHVHVC